MQKIPAVCGRRQRAGWVRRLATAPTTDWPPPAAPDSSACTHSSRCPARTTRRSRTLPGSAAGSVCGQVVSAGDGEAVASHRARTGRVAAAAAAAARPKLNNPAGEVADRTHTALTLAWMCCRSWALLLLGAVASATPELPSADCMGAQPLITGCRGLGSIQGTQALSYSIRGQCSCAGGPLQTSVLCVCHSADCQEPWRG